VSRILVVDASIAVDLLARYRPEPIEQALWAPGTHLAAPELLDIEALHALRRLDRDGRIPALDRGHQRRKRPDRIAHRLRCLGPAA
jgi:predicted nucleic acid-binding protein